jgi:hypothetical protein
VLIVGMPPPTINTGRIIMIKLRLILLAAVAMPVAAVAQMAPATPAPTAAPVEAPMPPSDPAAAATAAPAADPSATPPADDAAKAAEAAPDAATMDSKKKKNKAKPQ